MSKKRGYDMSKLELAIRDVQNGSSYRAASKKHGIPKSTIEFRVKNPGHKDSFGPSPILSSDEENTLVSWIKELARKGFPRKADDITLSVQKFLISNPREHPFKNNRPGYGWLKAFLKRHPDITERTSEAVTAASSCVSEKDIRKWFIEIEEYIREEKLEDVIKDPARVFNGDETGFQICPSTGKVFAAKGAKNVYSIDHGSSKENITVMFTFSADGKHCCPMIIYPYQRIPEKITNSVNPEWGIGRSDNGWMTADTFFQYIANVFHPYLIEKNVTLPVILFVDGHKSHLTYELSVLCKELQIEVIALYPNATRILQPADVAVFRPVKIAWRQAVREWYADHTDQVLNKISFAPLLEKVVDLSIKPETLINGFKACGLCPFNPDAIDFSKCLGSENNKENLTAAPERNAVREVSMQYNYFLDIVGKEKVEKFKSFDAIFSADIDDNFFDLYRIWKYYESRLQEKSKDKLEYDNTEQNVTCNNTINVLQNVTHVHTEDNFANTNELLIVNNSETNIVANSEINNIEKEAYELINNFETNTNSIELNNCSDFNKTTQQRESQSVTCTRVQSPVASTSRIESPLLSNVAAIVQSDLLGNYLTRPDTPQRKGIKKVERFPFAITAKKYQIMYEKKRALQEISERKKEEKKKKRDNEQAAKQEKGTRKKGTKRQVEQVNKPHNLKKAKYKEKKMCHVCLKLIKLNCELRCDDCEKVFHKLCVPKSHRIHIPDEDDEIYLCHNCYKEDSDTASVTESVIINEQTEEEKIENNEIERKKAQNEYREKEKSIITEEKEIEEKEIEEDENINKEDEIKNINNELETGLEEAEKFDQEVEELYNEYKNAMKAYK